MKSSFAVAACLPALALSAALVPRYNFAPGQCDAARTPTVSPDCDNVYQTLHDMAGGDPGYIFTPPGAGNTLSYTNGNCVVSLIFYDPSYTITYDLVTQGEGIYTSYCSTIPAGGQATLTGGQFAVSVYAPGNPPAKVKRTSAITGLTSYVTEKKALNKRDETWSNAYTVDNAAPMQYWQQVLNALPGGSNWELTDSETQTNMVQSTTTISADLFGIFSASEAITYGYTDSVTSSTTETIVNNCANDQEGYLYWTPLFTQYHGGFVPDGPTPLDIYVPQVNSDGSAAGNYIVQCSDQ